MFVIKKENDLFKIDDLDDSMVESLENENFRIYELSSNFTFFLVKHDEMWYYVNGCYYCSKGKIYYCNYRILNVMLLIIIIYSILVIYEFEKLDD